VMLWTLPWVAILQYSLLAWQQVPRFSWAFIGIRDMPPIAVGICTAAVVLLAVRYLLGMFVETEPRLEYAMIPASVVVCDAALAVLGIAGMRCVRRLQRQHRRAVEESRRAPRGTPTVLIGAGVGGRLLLQELGEHTDIGYQPVAFVDDDKEKVGRVVGGIRVLGTTADLQAIAARFSAKAALITIPSASGREINRIVDRCKAAGLQTKIVPHLHEIVSGRVRISQLRDVAIEDLLGRDPVVIDDSAAPAVVDGRVVVVTGAGGSIGSELCRQLLQLRPSRLVLVERTENSLYEIHRELTAGGLADRVVPELADVCDAGRMAELFEAHRPHVVFHAAAHKHVPMMERVPCEAIKNNVFGTKTVADLADRFGVERFVFVSTDKAVRPASVMGATKRLAELYLKDLAARSRVRYVSVRFGNVMGSAGSVIPLFREQIAKGGPVTVTHELMERFFMTIPEACRLVLEAAGLCEGDGEVMLLDMGKPVRIKELAENMIRLSGYEPGAQIRIAITGVRPGEKLHEELSLPEEMVDGTRCKKLFVWRGGQAALPVPAILERLRAPGHTPDEIRRTLRDVLPEYASAEPTAPMLPAVVTTAQRAGSLSA